MMMCVTLGNRAFVSLNYIYHISPYMGSSFSFRSKKAAYEYIYENILSKLITKHCSITFCSSIIELELSVLLCI